MADTMRVIDDVICVRLFVIFGVLSVMTKININLKSNVISLIKHGLIKLLIQKFVLAYLVVVL